MQSDDKKRQSDEDFTPVILGEEEIKALPPKKKKFSKLVEVPDYFYLLKPQDAHKYLLCLDKSTPQTVTHLAAVPDGEFDPTNLSHIINLKDGIGVDRLRKMCSFFKRKASGNLKECLSLLSDVKLEPLLVAKIKENDTDAKDRDLDMINRSKILFRMTTLVFGCPERSNEFGSLNKDRSRTVIETRKTETFYKELCDDINDENLECHASLLPYENPMFSNLYDGYLSLDNLQMQHPKHPVSALPVNNAKAFIEQVIRLRNIMVKNMTKSGSHDADAFNFVQPALRLGKKPRFITKEALYYFYMQADMNHGTMSSFTPSLPKGVSGANFVDLEKNAVSAKRQQQIAAEKFDEMQDMFKDEMNERKAFREKFESDKSVKVSIKEEQAKQRRINKERKLKLLEEQQANQMIDKYIERLEASIERFRKQELQYIKMLDRSTKSESIKCLNSSLEAVVVKIADYEEKLLLAEEQKLQSITRKASNDTNEYNSPHDDVHLYDDEDVTPYQDDDDINPAYGISVNVPQIETPMLTERPILATKGTSVVEKSVANEVPLTSNGGFSALAKSLGIEVGDTENHPPLNQGKKRYIPRGSKAYVPPAPQNESDVESVADLLAPLPRKYPHVPIGYEDVYDERESQHLIYLGRNGGCL